MQQPHNYEESNPLFRHKSSKINEIASNRLLVNYLFNLYFDLWNKTLTAKNKLKGWLISISE